ncbi:PGC-1 and ERR-induced regulator in muscle protein 1 isoform 2-T2 [Leptodactylus fuscus]|uniref:PGC-1 and ERR-induced regulator in muscle protein 1 isoform X2 n=1 Tax=Leptodactylus fuscus TaxID=238119 RepID=UPI003F4E902B
MDNFEYSIQINDRDWEEFYSTAEECGLMQVSLATEEELWLSDTEQEDTTNSSLSNKAKFIRISLCPPPPPQEERPAPQTSHPVVSQCVKTSDRWLGPSEDILSGSEDEEEFGSVTRFLCQKEYMLQKKDSKQSRDIPLPKLVDHHDLANQLSENSRGENLVEYMRTLNVDSNVQYKVDPQQDMGKTTMEVNSNSQDQPGLPGLAPMAFVQPDGDPRPMDNITYANNSPVCSHEIDSCSSVNSYLQGENIPNVNSDNEITGKMWHSTHEATLLGSLSKDESGNPKHEMFDDPTSLEEPSSSKHNGLIYYTMENDTLDSSCEVATEANVNSSAVEQNVPTSSFEELDISRSDSLDIEAMVPSNTHSPVDCTSSVHSLVPANTTTKAWRHLTPLTQTSSSYYRKNVLTLPEMYDFFFDDVSDTVFLETEPNMASNDGIVYTPEMYEYFFLENEEDNRGKSKDDNSSQASSTDLALLPTSSVAATWPEACEFFFADGPQYQDREGILLRVPSSQAQSVADMIQSFVPRGLKGFTVRRTRHRRDPDGSLNPQDHHGTSQESSSALLANIGAVSAIQYLRRRSRRTWQESPPESGAET